MKKIPYLATLCCLLMVSCIGINNNITPGPQDVSKDASEDPSKDTEIPPEDVYEPEGAVSGWMQEIYYGDNLSMTSKVTFHYDAKDRICSYDETQQLSGGSPSDYVRVYHWASDSQLEFYNTDLSHKRMCYWTFDDRGRAVTFDTSAADPEDEQHWTLSYDDNDRLACVNGYFRQYIDEDDLRDHSDWNKALNFEWTSGGDIAESYELWTASKSTDLERNRRQYKFSSAVNPFLGETVDPTVCHIFDRMYMGIYGSSPKHLVSGIIVKDDETGDVGEEYTMDYLDNEDGILVDIKVTVKQYGYLLNTYKYHIFYYGIPDKPGVEQQIIN